MLSTDPIAKVACELCIGSDGIVRINVDGRCVLRIRVENSAQLCFAGPDFDIAESWLRKGHTWHQQVPVAD